MDIDIVQIAFHPIAKAICRPECHLKYHLEPHLDHFSAATMPNVLYAAKKDIGQPTIFCKNGRIQRDDEATDILNSMSSKVVQHIIVIYNNISLSTRAEMKVKMTRKATWHIFLINY